MKTLVWTRGIPGALLTLAMTAAIVGGAMSFLVVLWTLAVLLVYATALFAVFYSGVSTVAALPPDSTAASSGMNVLIVGSDSRAGLSEEQQNELSTGSVEGNRTDTIMLLHVPLLGEPTLVSIPRDSWVPIPGYGSDKINSAFALGGPQLLVRTVEDVTGLQITDYIEVGFAGVAATTDAMGGVVLCPRQDFNDENSGLNVKAGCQTMDGPTALAYVRMRYADPRGDLGRARGPGGDPGGRGERGPARVRVPLQPRRRRGPPRRPHRPMRPAGRTPGHHTGRTCRVRAGRRGERCIAAGG